MILHDEKPDVIPNPDPRSLQVLVMALSEEEFKRITKRLSLTPKLTPNEFRNMLLEEAAKQATVTKESNAASQDSVTDEVAGGGGRKATYCNNCKKDDHSEDKCWLLQPELSRKPPCSACGNLGHGEDQCWRVNVKLAPAWLQKRLLKQDNAEEKGKSKGKKTNVCCLCVEDS